MSLGALTGDAIPVPRDAVGAVTVEAEPGSDERPAEFLAIVGVQRRPGLLEDGMGQRLTLPIPGDQPRHPHGVVVHAHLFLVPRDAADQRVEQLISRADETRPQIDPGALGELPALHGRTEADQARLT